MDWLSRKLIHLNPKAVTAYNKGTVFLNQGKLKEAIECYDESIKLDPKSILVWNNKGNALRRQGKVKESIECYDEALKIDPKYVSAWNNKGFALQNQGKFKEAIECYDESIKINPKHIIAWNNKGFALQNQGKLKEAIECYDESIKINPKYVIAWNNKGNALKHQGKFEGAIECFDEIIKLYPKNIIAWNNKGIALQNQGKFKEAIECYDEVINLNPKSVFPLVYKALILDIIGNVNEAEIYYLKANEMNQLETEKLVDIILNDNKIEKGKLFLSKFNKNVKTESDIAVLLRELEIGQYIESFNNIGAKSIDEILSFEEDDWKHLNVLPFHKKKILASISKKGNATDTTINIHQNQGNTEVPIPTLGFESTPALLIPAKGFKNRFVFEERESSDYKGVVATINNFTPTKTCKEYIQEISKEEGCHKFGLILDDCEHWISLNMQKPSFNPQNLDQNEVLALVIYTWDLGFNGEREENFYFVLNNILRKRTPVTVKKWVGYLYFMQKALSKLPDLKEIVYRGVPDQKLIEDNYTLGRQIHWSAFSSTSTNLDAACEFATPEGVVLSIQILNGKCIQHYSPFGGKEAEILLSPNMSFLVVEGIHQYNGYNRVVLFQVAPEKTFVF